MGLNDLVGAASLLGMESPFIVATPETFDGVVGGSGGLVVVYFWGDRCPNCDVFKAQLGAIQSELEGVAVKWVSVDAYLHTALATRFGLFGVPAFVLFQDGKRLGMMREFRGTRFFVDVIREQSAMARIESR